MNAKTDPESFDIEPLKAFLCEVGNSVVCFKTDSIVKLHVHTMTPEKVLEYCRKFGEFLTIKIENMSVQHTENADKKEDKEDKKDKEEKAEQAHVSPTHIKKYGIVAVTNGAGIEGLFKDLGTDEIVQGGQTQNPSTNDFIDAFEKVPAEHIFVFPNNGNIIMAAQQAAEIYKNAKVHVIPSKNIGMGYVAISSADFSKDDVDTVVEEMKQAMSRVTTGYISPSIRNADMNGVHINKGDTIGIIEKEIVVSENSRMDASKKMASLLLEDNSKFMLTIFYGQDSNFDECAELEAYMKENHPSAEIYFVDGGQAIYPFIFVAE
jgi:dihydroxyacetone kinase-like predicted kinase